MPKLSKELHVINEKQLKCLYRNKSSLGNKVETLELLGQDTKQDPEEMRETWQKKPQKNPWNVHKCSVQHCEGFGRLFWKKWKIGKNAECFYQRWIAPEILRVGAADRRKAADLIQTAFNHTFPTLPDGREDGAEEKLLWGMEWGCWR